MFCHIIDVSCLMDVLLQFQLEQQGVGPAQAFADSLKTVSSYFDQALSVLCEKCGLKSLFYRNQSFDIAEFFSQIAKPLFSNSLFR